MKITGAIPEQLIYMKKPTYRQAVKTVARAAVKVATRPFRNDDVKALTRKRK